MSISLLISNTPEKKLNLWPLEGLSSSALILFVSPISIKKIVISIFSFLILLPYAWINILKDYQKGRILNLIDPFSNPLDGGYHAIQSSIAIGSGGLFGKSSEFSSQHDLLFLPETHTDFIFAVLSENYGFLGNIIFFLIFFLFVYRLINISINLHSHSHRLLAMTYVMIFILCFSLYTPISAINSSKAYSN